MVTEKEGRRKFTKWLLRKKEEVYQMVTEKEGRRRKLTRKESEKKDDAKRRFLSSSIQNTRFHTFQSDRKCFQ